MMIDYLKLFTTSFLALFVIINPFGNIPVFLAITEHENKKRKRQIVKRASIVCFFVLVVFLLAGEQILKLFHITIGSFKIAGGIILFIIAIGMLMAHRSLHKSRPEEEEEALKKDDVSITPLAIPMLSGPGAITTALMLSDNVSGIFRTSTLVFSLLVSCFVTYIILIQSVYLLRIFRQTGINIMTRIMGLLLTVIAVQFVVNGLSDVLPQILEKIK